MSTTSKVTSTIIAGFGIYATYWAVNHMFTVLLVAAMVAGIVKVAGPALARRKAEHRAQPSVAATTEPDWEAIVRAWEAPKTELPIAQPYHTSPTAAAYLRQTER